MRLSRVALWLFLPLLILVHEPVHAEWVALEARSQPHPLQTVYIDPGSLHRDGHLLTISALVDWKAMQGGRTPTRFYSTKLTKQFDCAERLVRTVAATDFCGHMGTGEIIGGGGHASGNDWITIEPESLNERLREVVCGK